MVEISEIEDEDSLEAWLDAVPEADRKAWAVFIASRAAARVAPLLWAEFNRNKKLDVTDQRVWRVIPISRVAGTMPTRDIAAYTAAFAAADTTASASDAYTVTAAAFAAADTTASAAYTVTTATDAAARSAAAFAAADTAARSATDAAYAATVTTDAYAAAARSAATASVWEAIRADARHLAEGGAVTDQPGLWPGAMPETLLKDWDAVKNALRATDTPEDWEFWITWYETELADHGLFADNAAHWDLLADIFEVTHDPTTGKKTSLLDEDDWEKGSAHVNPIIRRHYEEAKLAAEQIAEVIEQTPNAEKIVVDPESGKLTSVAVDDLGDAFRAEITEEIETAMRRFLEGCAVEDGHTNMGKTLLRLSERDLNYLREDMANPRYGDRAFHDKIASCHAALSKRFREEGLQDDPDVARLLETLDIACLTIIASSDEVRDVVHRRTEEMFRRLQVEQLATFQMWAMDMAEDALPDLAEAMRQDWARATDAEATETDRRQAQYNLVSRVPRGARAIRYSRFENGYRVVPEKEKQKGDKMWWATALAPSGAAILAKLLGG